MQYYNRLSLEERENINHYLKLGTSITKIAEHLNRSKSTISREIKRGTTNNNYCPIYSEERFISGLSRNKALFLDNNLRNFVIDKIVNCRWSPAAISGRIKTFHDLKLKASYETIEPLAKRLSFCLKNYFAKNFWFLRPIFYLKHSGI